MVGNQMLTLLSNTTTNLSLTDMGDRLQGLRWEVVRKLKAAVESVHHRAGITAKIARLRCRVLLNTDLHHGRTYEERKIVRYA